MNISALSLSLCRPGGISLEQLVAGLFSAGEQGAWYDPSGNNTTWRRNRLTYTQEFDNAAWGGVSSNQVTVSANQTTAPDGTTTAELVAETTDNVQHNLFTQDGGFATSASGIAYTMSVYLKKGPGATAPDVMQLTLRANGFGTAQYANFSLVGGGVLFSTGGTASIESVGNGWYRCVWTAVSTAAAANSGVGIIFCNNASNATRTPAYVGSTTSNVYVWGAQLEEGFVATAYQRIITPEITYLSTVQAQPLLFQDSAGTLPVTEVEQPVGLMLDRRKGLALGSELADEINTTSGWIAFGSNTVAAITGGVAITYVGGTNAGNGAYATLNTTSLTSALTVGKFYKLTFQAAINTGTATIKLWTGAVTIASQTVSSSNFTDYTYHFLCGGVGDLSINSDLGAGEVVQFRNFSIKEIDGNHAYQTTSSARPHLRSRYNLLTYSEQFDNAAWSRVDNANVTVTANAAVAPDGTTTADRIKFTTGNLYSIYQNVNSITTAGVAYTYSVWLRADTATSVQFGFYDAGTSRDVSVNITTTWARFTHTATITKTGGSDIRAWLRSQNNGEEFYAWGAQLVVGSTAMSYQRIAAAPTLSQPPTYATTSTMGGEVFRPYIEADGSDDVLVLASNPLTGATAATEVHGAWRPLGNAAGNGAVFGSFGSDATLSDHEPYTDDIWYSGFASTARQAFASISVVASPYILEQVQSGTTLAAYRNGTQISTTKTVNFSLGTSARIFSSPASAIPYWRGRFYSGVVIGRVLSAAETTSLRSYVANKAGVTL